MANQSRSEPRTVLEHLVREKNRTYEEMAALFAATARKAQESATISPRHFGRLARGERPAASTTPGTQRVLGLMFGLSVDELLSPWGHDLALAAQPVIDGTTPSPGNEGGLLVMAAQRARRFSVIAGDAGASPDVVDQCRDDVQRLATLYPQRPLSELLGDLVDVQEGLFTLLERRQRPEVGRQLYFLSAAVGGMLAKASHDTGEAHAAMLQARTAYLCAEQADHNGLRGWLRGLQSMVAYWAGRHNEAVRYAEQGMEYAAVGGGTTAIWLPVSAARAYAALGDVDNAVGSIQRAETAWEHVQPDEVDELGGLCTFSTARTIYYAADALAWTPGQPDAERYAEQAVAAYADPTDASWAFSDQAGAHTDLAIARITRGELEGAAEALAPVLDLPPERRINGIRHSVQRVHATLTSSRASGDGAAAGMQEEIEAFMRTPVAALPR